MLMIYYNMESELIWNIIDKYFNDNPNSFVAHHLDSYNDFFNIGLKQILKEKNPIKIIIIEKLSQMLKCRYEKN